MLPVTRRASSSSNPNKRLATAEAHFSSKSNSQWTVAYLSDSNDFKSTLTRCPPAPDPRHATLRGLLVLEAGAHSFGSNEIYGFDMDDTLTVTKSGRKFAQNSDDWKWWHSSVPEKLRELHARGAKVIIFTNQSGINYNSYNYTKERSICERIEKVVEAIGIPMLAFVSTTRDGWRKPSPKMWHVATQHYNEGVEVDLSRCCFVGDAAGRPAGWAPSKKKDFSDSDVSFARNVGCSFNTPEQFFLGQSASSSSVPPALGTSGKTIENFFMQKRGDTVTLLKPSNTQEMIIFVGYPASGKSTVAQSVLEPEGYVRVNQDTLKTRANCIKAARTALQEGASVVIDNTCPDTAVRAEFIALAREFKIPVRCVRFGANENQAKKLNLLRNKVTSAYPLVPAVAYSMFKKRFVEPQLSEGFTEIIQMPLNLQFPNEEVKQLFQSL